MSPQSLFRHPVGRFPLAARWWLACSAMLALLLTAAHFANQIRAQEKARAAVAAWAARAGAHVGEVRYRLLRNALELRDVRWRNEVAEAAAARLLVRLDPASFSTASPRVRRLRLEHAVVTLPAGGGLAGWRSAAEGLAAALGDARRVELADFRLRIRRADGSAADWLRLEAGDAFWRGVGGWRGHWRGDLAGGAFFAEWRKGVVRWRVRRAAARLFGADDLTGRVDASGHWPLPPAGAVGGSAELVWRARGGEARLRLMREARGIRWRAERWPLASARGLLAMADWPATGRVNAEGVLGVDAQAGWQLRAPAGEVRDAAWRDGRRAARLTWKGLRANAGGWRAESLELADGVWRWPPDDARGAGMAMSRIGRAAFRNMTLLLPAGLRAPGLSGAVARRPGGWRLEARSPAADMADGLAGVRLVMNGSGAGALFDLRAAQVNLARGDHCLRLREVTAEGGVSPDGWRLRRVHAAHWRWRAPLAPFTGAMDGGAAEEKAEAWFSAFAQPLHGWRLDALLLEDGRLAVGREDAVWGEGLAFEAHDVASGATARWQLRGRLAEGELAGRGEWTPGGADSGELALRHALPFAFNEWLRASRMPALLRGRLEARLRWGDGRWRLTGALAHPLPEEGAFPDDPMLRWAGRSMRDVLAFWPARRGVLHLEAAGERGGMLRALREAVRRGLAKGAEARNHAFEWSPEIETAVRLHARSGLSHNERKRLRRIWRALRSHRDWVVELSPRWNGELSAEMIARIRRTQRLAERFFTERGVAPSRVFPVWPSRMHRGGELGAVRVGAGPLR